MDPSCPSHETSMNPKSCAGYGEPPPSYSTECPTLTGGTTCPADFNQSSVIPTAPEYFQDFPPSYSAFSPNEANTYTPYPTRAANWRPQNHIISTEPTWTFGNPARTSDYFSSSILSLICCFPLGVLALIYSFKTRDAVKRDDPLWASRYSTNTRVISNLGIGLGVLFHFAWIGFVIYYIYESVRHKNDLDD